MAEETFYGGPISNSDYAKENQKLRNRISVSRHKDNSMYDDSNCSTLSRTGDSPNSSLPTLAHDFQNSQPSLRPTDEASRTAPIHNVGFLRTSDSSELPVRFERYISRRILSLATTLSHFRDEGIERFVIHEIEQERAAKIELETIQAEQGLQSRSRRPTVEGMVTSVEGKEEEKAQGDDASDQEMGRDSFGISTKRARPDDLEADGGDQNRDTRDPDGGIVHAGILKRRKKRRAEGADIRPVYAYET